MPTCAQTQQPLLQVAVARELLGGHFVRNASIDHHANPAGHRQRHPQVLLNQQHRNIALLRQLTQRLGDLLNNYGSQALGGFIHYQKFGLQQQGAANCQHLLFTARQLRTAVGLALRQARKHGIHAVYLSPLRCNQTQSFIDSQ